DFKTPATTEFDRSSQLLPRLHRHGTAVVGMKRQLQRRTAPNDGGSWGLNERGLVHPILARERNAQGVCSLFAFLQQVRRRSHQECGFGLSDWFQNHAG